MTSTLPDGPLLSPDWMRLQWFLRPLPFLEACQQRYGDAFTLRFAGPNSTPYVVCSHPTAIAQIFNAPPATFASGCQNTFMAPLLGMQSLLLLDGDSHRQQRKILMPPFHGDRLRSYGQTICDLTDEMLVEWQIGSRINLRTALQDLTLNIITQVVLGHCDQNCVAHIRPTLSQLVAITNAPPLHSLPLMGAIYRWLYSQSRLEQSPLKQPPLEQFGELKQSLDRDIETEIHQRRHIHKRRQWKVSSRDEDVLDTLLNVQDESGIPLSTRQVRDQIITLLVAGHETTASALIWALYWIQRHACVRERLLNELHTLAPDAEPIEIARLPYLSVVVSETLRIYPIAFTAFERLVQSPVQILDYTVLPGTVVLPCIYLVHRRPDLYPDPKQFRPERFLERSFAPHEYLPFGGASRTCIGMAFAQFEMKLILARVLARVQLKRRSWLPVKPVRRGVTIAPPAGLGMVVKPPASAASATSTPLKYWRTAR